MLGLGRRAERPLSFEFGNGGVYVSEEPHDLSQGH